MKRTSAKRKANKAVDIIDKESNQTIIYTGLAVAMVIVILSIITNGLGVVGFYTKYLSFTILGIGSYFVPFFILMHSMILVFGKKEWLNLKKTSLVYGSLALILAIISINMLDEIDFNSYFSEVFEMSKQFTGPGIVGAVVGYFLSRLVGKLGVYLLASVTFFLAVLSVTGISSKAFFLSAFSVLKRLGTFLKEHFEKIISNKGDGKVNIPSTKEKISINDGEKVGVNRDYNDLKIVGLPDRSRNTETINAEESNERKQLTVEDFNIEVENVEMQYNYPPVQLLKDKEIKTDGAYVDEAKRNAKIIEDTLKSFKIDCKIVQVNRGPAVTCYELQPAGGVKLSSIVNLQDNLALNLATQGIRIEAPIPGKAVVGIEVPNKVKEFVSLKEIIDSDSFRNSNSFMPLALGKDIYGSIVVSGMEKMPHLLIAGATGSGKSVCINSIISSILFKSSPEDVKLILIDPKMVELNVYNGIPHLVIPVVTDPKKASAALNWAVREMDRRYQVFSDNYVRDINSYKDKFKNDSSMEKMPYICIIIDELSDLMMVASQEVESHICRLAQLARACGIHLIVATQRPSVDVITGLIKANIPSRISFSVSSQIDSRTILDMSGAENLLGNGDMLFFPSNIMKPKRVQGAFISEKEVENLVNFIKNSSEESYDKAVIEEIEDNRPKMDNSTGDYDEHLMDAIDTVIQDGQASVSLIQRKLRVGYARAGRIIDEMENLGIVGPHEGSKPRKILVSRNILREEKIDEYSQQADDV